MKKLILLLSILFISAVCTAYMNPGMHGNIGHMQGGSNGAIGATTAETTKKIVAHAVYHSDFNTAEGDGAAGPVRYGHVYLSDGNSRNICLILTDNAGNLLLSCNGVASDDTVEWFDCDAGSTYNIQNGTEYYVGIQRDGGDVYIYRYNDDGGSTFYDGFFGYDCLSNINPEENLDVFTNKLTIIWDMTPTR